MKKIITEMIHELAHQLRDKDWSLVTAESCSGGGLSHFITKIPYCSGTLERGYVVYSETAKQELLQVSSETLKKFGAVSEATAREMAEGALKNSHAQVSIAITGLAGPKHDHHSPEPIGKVYFGCAAQNKSTQVISRRFSGNRKRVCEKSIIASLQFLINYIKA